MLKVKVNNFLTPLPPFIPLFLFPTPYSLFPTPLPLTTSRPEYSILLTAIFGRDNRLKPAKFS
jgi:hypothetical protein